MKLLTQILCLVAAVSGVAQSKLPIYNNFKIVKEYKMDDEANKTFVAAPFAKPELKLDGALQGRAIKKITYLYSYNNNHPEFAQSELSDQRYRNLVEILADYDLTNVEWETNAQAGCGEIPCSEELYHGFVIEYEDPSNFLAHHLLETQTFKVSNNAPTTITGKDGTKLEIPANAFVDPFGNPVTGEVEIELKEAVTMQDIVLGGMYTVTDGGVILQSKGMIEIQASQGEQELELNGRAEIKVELPTSYEEGYQLFEGQHENGQLVWSNPVPLDNEAIDLKFENETRVDEPELEIEEYNGRKEGSENDFLFDIVESREMMDFYPLKVEYQKGSLLEVTVMNYGKRLLVTSQTTTAYLKEKGLRQNQIDMVTKWFAEDTVVHEKIQWTVTDFQDISFDDYVRNLEQDQQEYARNNILQNNVFGVTKTGWSNCDKYYSMKDKNLAETLAEFENPEDFENTQVCVIVPGDNVCVQGTVTTKGNMFVVPLPKDKQAILIATTWKEDQFYMAIQEYRIGEEIPRIVPEITDESEVRKRIYNAL